MEAAIRLAVLGVLTVVLASAAVPRLMSVEPEAVKPGDQVTANGSNLDSTNVTKFFLTAGGKDIQVKMDEQTADSITFTVPADTELGNYNLMVQTGGPTPALMEQPVICAVDDAEGIERRARELEEFLADPEPEPEAEPEPEPQQ